MECRGRGQRRFIQVVGGGARVLKGPSDGGEGFRLGSSTRDFPLVALERLGNIIVWEPEGIAAAGAHRRHAHSGTTEHQESHQRGEHQRGEHQRGAKRAEASEEERRKQRRARRARGGKKRRRRRRRCGGATEGSAEMESRGGGGACPIADPRRRKKDDGVWTASPERARPKVGGGTRTTDRKSVV